MTEEGNPDLTATKPDTKPETAPEPKAPKPVEHVPLIAPPRLKDGKHPSGALRDQFDSMVHSIDWTRKGGEEPTPEVRRAVESLHMSHVDWNVGAAEPASPERWLVFTWGERMNLTLSGMGGRFRGAYGDIMHEFIVAKVREKVLDYRMESSRSSWNDGNCWNPLRGLSYCGYVRGLVRTMAPRSSARVFGHREKSLTDIPTDGDDDGEGRRVWAPADRHAVDTDPDIPLLVPRPVGNSLTQARREWGEHGSHAAVQWLKAHGYWRRKFDQPDTVDVLGWMLGAVSKQSCMQLAPTCTPPHKWRGTRREWDTLCAETWGLYWPTQVARPSGRIQWGPLRRHVDLMACGCPTMRVWATLGGWAARCV